MVSPKKFCDWLDFSISSFLVGQIFLLWCYHLQYRFFVQWWLCMITELINGSHLRLQSFCVSACSSHQSLVTKVIMFSKSSLVTWDVYDESALIKLLHETKSYQTDRNAISYARLQLYHGNAEQATFSQDQMHHLVLSCFSYSSSFRVHWTLILGTRNAETKPLDSHLSTLSKSTPWVEGIGVHI